MTDYGISILDNRESGKKVFLVSERKELVGFIFTAAVKNDWHTCMTKFASDSLPAAKIEATQRARKVGGEAKYMIRGPVHDEIINL